MATLPAPQAMSDMKNLSFAKVAASASKDVDCSASRAAHSSIATDFNAKSLAPLTNPSAGVENNGRTQDGKNPSRESLQNQLDGSTGGQGIKRLADLKMAMNPPSLVLNGSGSTSPQHSSKAGNSQTPSDLVSNKADSSSELGTKPPSLDGKSITSGTTFNVLDEKESLRPDDSASVKAAADEDDAFSIRGSLIANSRMGSDVAGRLRTIQIGDMPPRALVAHTPPVAHIQGNITPESGISGQQAVVNGVIPLTTAQAGPEAFSGFYSKNPDEKLLEAMKSSKDRLFLLRLEKEVIDFVQDSKEPFMDLPPCNSFCRLLTHKLADYYHMTHSFEAVAGAVRIYRTPFCRVPPSLQSIAAANDSTSSTPPPALLPRKIMRRGEEGDSAPVSAGPSKPTSEDGSDLKEKTGLLNQKLTREEREEAYNKARLRIFGTTAETETSSPGDTEDGADVSRASSVSVRDKAQAKRAKPVKQRRDDSESFDSRSQYTPYYTHPHQPQMWAPMHVPVSNANTQFSPQPQQQASFTPVYGTPNQQYPPAPVAPNNTFSSSQYISPPMNPSAPINNGRFPLPAQPTQPYTVVQAQGAPPQHWPQQTFNGPQPQGPYQVRVQTSGPPSTASSGPPSGPSPGIPYPYGQLPCHTNPQDPKSQHPIPGSYNRHGFNPKTQSFIPANGMGPLPIGHVPPGHVPPAVGAFPGPGPMQPPVGPVMPAQPPMAYGPPVMSHPAQYGGVHGGYGMIRQGSNNSMPPQFHHMAQPQQPVMVHHTHQHQYVQQHQATGPPMMPHHHQQMHNPSPRVPNKPAMSQGHPAAPTFSHLPTYGNPATLPQKPSL